MPWFDETYFASMARHFCETGEFFSPVCPLMDYYYPQSKAYGPAYFVLLAAVFKVFGFGIVQMRLPALMLGFAFILIAYRMLKESNINPLIRKITFVLLLFDPIFLQNIHSGRMDSLALFLSGAGSLFLLRGVRNSGYRNHMIAGLLMGIAILSTPRVAVNLIGAGAVAAICFFSSPSWKAWWKLVLIPLLIIGLYSVWVFWGFGGYVEAWNYFFGQPREKLYYDNLAQGYISFRKYIPPFQFPALILLLILLGNWLLRRWTVSWLFWICIFNLAAYFLFVRDTGVYSIFSIPWVYLLLAELGNRFLRENNSALWLKISLILLICLNSGLFCIKQSVVLLSAESRDDNQTFNQFKKLIPEGSRVIGDEAYYYTAVRNKCEFQYIDRGASGFQRLDYHVNDFDFEYIILRNPVSNPTEFSHYQSAVPLRKIGEINSSDPSPFIRHFEYILKKLGSAVPGGYRGVVYKR